MDPCIVCRNIQKFLFTYQKYKYFKCINCGLVSTYPLPSKKQIKNHYKKEFNKGNYKFLRQFSKQYLRIYEGFISEIKKYLNENNKSLKGLKILDIGCFTGDFLYLMLQEGASIYGVELQNRAVEIAKKRLPGKIVQKDIATNPFKNTKFDIITMLGLIEHVENPINVIKDVSKMLAKDGLVVIQTPNSNSFLAHVLNRYWPPFTPVEHIHLFSRKSIGILLKKNGLEEVFFKNHFKILPVGYVYNMLDIFGPEIKRIFKKMEKIINFKKSLLPLPFYIGEMFLIAKKE